MRRICLLFRRFTALAVCHIVQTMSRFRKIVVILLTSFTINAYGQCSTTAVDYCILGNGQVQLKATSAGATSFIWNSSVYAMSLNNAGNYPRLQLNINNNAVVTSQPGTSAALNFTGKTATRIYTIEAIKAVSPYRTKGMDRRLTVNDVPTISLGTNPSICRGTTTANLTFSATTGSPNQYSIDYDAIANTAGFADIINKTLPASPITLTVPGTAVAGVYNGTLTVKNSTTGGVSISYYITVTVNALPTITRVSNVCLGLTTQWTGTGTPALSSAWISATPTVATVDNNGLITGVVAGTSRITYTDINGCSETRTIGVGALPKITFQPADKTGCYGSDIVFSANTTPTVGIYYQWQYKDSNGNFKDIDGASGYTSPIRLTLSNISGNGEYRVIITMSEGGCSDTSTVAKLTVNQPAPGGPDVTCQSSNPSPITLSGASVGGGATTGAWSITSGDGTLSSTAQTTTPATVTYTPAANYSGTVTLTLTTDDPVGLCGAVSATRIITVNPAPVTSLIYHQ